MTPADLAAIAEPEALRCFRNEWTHTIGVHDMRAMVAYVDALHQQLADAGRDGALAKFGATVLVEYAQRADRGDIEGGGLQDDAVRCGVMDRVQRVTPCGDSCACAAYYGDGETATCYPVCDWAHVKALATGGTGEGV